MSRTGSARCSGRVADPVRPVTKRLLAGLLGQGLDGNEVTTMDEHPQEPKLLTVTETAKLLRLSRAYTYELAARGDIPTIRLGRRIIIPRKALEHWLDDNTAA